MARSLVPFAFAAALAFTLVAPGCDYGVTPIGYVPSSSTVSDGAVPAADLAGMTGSLPCDVNALLVAHCQLCHAKKPVAGAPMPLVTYANLLAASFADPTMTFAERCLARMQDMATPMPPAGQAPVSSQEIATFSAWVKAGSPSMACVADAGSGDGG